MCPTRYSTLSKDRRFFFSSSGACCQLSRLNNLTHPYNSFFIIKKTLAKGSYMDILKHRLGLCAQYTLLESSSLWPYSLAFVYVTLVKTQCPKRKHKALQSK